MRFFLSFSEQGMGALLTFAINMWMARDGLPASYGVYAFWLTIAWITGTAQSTLVTSHLMSLPQMQPEKRTELEQFFLTIQVYFIGGATFIAASATALLDAINSSFSAIGTLLFLPGFLLFQYVRVLAFSRQKPVVATCLTGGILCTATLMIGCFHFIGGAPTSSNGLFVAGAAYATVSLSVLLYLMGRNCKTLPIKDMKPHLHILHSSGWILLGAGSSELTNRLYSFVTAWHYGPSALAALSATQITLRPAWMLSAAWTSAELPRLSHMWHEKKQSKFLLFLGIGLLLPTVGSIVWGVLVWWGWQPITQILYRGRYADASNLVLFWGGNVILGSIISSLTCAFLASRRFKTLAFTDIAGAIAAIICIFSLTQFLPFPYIIVGTMAGQITQAIGLAIGLYFLLKKEKIQPKRRK
ncbi:hypothetical protein NKW45_00370 [Acetobacter orientalis]|uniref:lipopolysaccharide biosynthesis protein n=1 Tax=Acetobacter orientalis TaxID=146474 RepID=UPI0020A55F0E|nr:hypothetical protein [Acetobacter orientalis]MCP1220302.1 hypothetical protein [Acetobacter orientalis]